MPEEEIEKPLLQDGDVYVPPGGTEEGPVQAPVHAATVPPTGRTVAIGGQDYTVDEETAQALEDERAVSHASRADEQRQLQEYRERQARAFEVQFPGQTPQGVQKADPLTDPEEYGRLLEERITRNLTVQYNQAQNTQSWWHAFDTKHPELVPYRGFVQQVIAQSGAQWNGLTNDQARTKVAEEATKQLVSIAETFQPKTSARPGRPLRMAESGGATVPAAAQEPVGTVHADSLGGAMRERNARRKRTA